MKTREEIKAEAWAAGEDCWAYEGIYHSFDCDGCMGTEDIGGTEICYVQRQSDIEWATGWSLAERK